MARRKYPKFPASIVVTRDDNDPSIFLVWNEPSEIAEVGRDVHGGVYVLQSEIVVTTKAEIKVRTTKKRG